MQINCDKDIVDYTTFIETKSKLHYDFIKKQFCDAYLTEKEFLEREDYFVVVMRSPNGVIIGLCLVRRTAEEDRIYVKPPPVSEIDYKFKKEYWILNDGKQLIIDELPRKQKRITKNY